MSSQEGIYSLSFTDKQEPSWMSSDQALDILMSN